MDMKHSSALLIIILLALEQYSYSQTVDDYFYPGATFFVQDKLNDAKLKVEEGLQIFPSDPKLVELYKRILENQNQDQQQNQNDQNKNQNEQNKDQQKQDQQNQNQQQDEQKQQQQQQSQQQKEQELTKKEAEKILNALKENEKDLQKQLRKVRGQRVKTEKDW